MGCVSWLKYVHAGASLHFLPFGHYMTDSHPLMVAEANQTPLPLYLNSVCKTSHNHLLHYINKPLCCLSFGLEI